MIKVRATRNQWVASTTGHSVNLVAGEIVEIPDVILTEVILAGGIPIEEEVAIDAETGVATDVLIREAVEQILAENNRVDFTAEGFPKCAAVIKRTGIADVKTADIKKAMDAIKADTAEVEQP